MKTLLIAGMLILAYLAADPARAVIPMLPHTAAPKASSFAPHPTKRRVFGAPIQKPIAHRVVRRKPH